MKKRTGITGLPQELLDTILRNLDPYEDIETLRRCSLVASCLLSASQRALFRHVTLTWTIKDRFHSLLEASPHLAEYVTEVQLLLVSWEWERNNVSIDLLSSIIQRCKALQKAMLHVSWSTVTPAPNFYALLGGDGAPRIRSFELYTFQPIDLNEIFNICRCFAVHGGLQDLHLQPLRITSEAPLSSSGANIPALRLRKLGIAEDVGFQGQAVDVFLRWATSSHSCLRFNELHELAVGGFTELSIPHLLSIFSISSNSLRRLDFLFGLSIRSPLSSLRFNSCRNLRTISCSMSAYQILDMWCTAIECSDELRLSEFVVNIPKSAVWNVEYPWNWVQFEDVLVRVARCRKLVVKIDSPESDERLPNDTLRKWFPKAHDGEEIELVLTQRLGSGSANGKVNWEYKPKSHDWKVAVLLQHSNG